MNGAASPALALHESLQHSSKNKANRLTANTLHENDEKWSGPKHEWEDWPGGINTFPSWQEVVADAAEQGLA